MIVFILYKQFGDSIAADTEASDISEEHKKILDERLEKHNNHPEDIVSWDEVKESVKKRNTK